MKLIFGSETLGLYIPMDWRDEQCQHLILLTWPTHLPQQSERTSTNMGKHRICSVGTKDGIKSVARHPAVWFDSTLQSYFNRVFIIWEMFQKIWLILTFEDTELSDGAWIAAIAVNLPEPKIYWSTPDAQKSAARLLTQTYKQDHITPAVASLVVAPSMSLTSSYRMNRCLL